MNEKFEFLSQLSFSDNPSPIAVVAVNDGQIFSVYEDRSCTMWDANDHQSPQVIHEYPGIRGSINSTVISGPNSILTGSQDGTLREWIVTNDELYQSEIHKNEKATPIKVIAVNTDRTCIALGLENGNIDFYQKQGGDSEEEWGFMRSISAHNSEVTCLSWNNNTLATGARDRFVHVIDIADQMRPSVPLDLHTATVTAVNWIHDDHGNTRLVTGGLDKALFFLGQAEDDKWDREKWVKTSTSIHAICGTTPFVAVGKSIQSYDYNGELIKTYDIEKSTKNICAISLNEDETVIAGSTGTLITAFDVSTASAIITIPCNAISLQIVGTNLIAGDAEGTISCWEIHREPQLSRSRPSILPMPIQKSIPASTETSTTLLPQLAPIIATTIAAIPEEQSEASGESVEKVVPKSTKTAKRRSQWNAFPTPFKVDYIFDCVRINLGNNRTYPKI